MFPGLSVNHIIDVNFGGFADLVNAIGCVYTDVDHRYYNNTALTNYSSIDIQPGYQKLCGTAARSRSCASATPTPTSSATPASRTSSAGPRTSSASATLIANRDTLLQIFGAHAQTDHNLHTTDGLINLFNLVAFSAGHTIKQIPFPAILCRAACGHGRRTRPDAVLRDRRSGRRARTRSGSS